MADFSAISLRRPPPEPSDILATLTPRPGEVPLPGVVLAPPVASDVPVPRRLICEHCGRDVVTVGHAPTGCAGSLVIDPLVYPLLP